MRRQAFIASGRVDLVPLALLLKRTPAHFRLRLISALVGEIESRKKPVSWHLFSPKPARN